MGFRMVAECLYYVVIQPLFYLLESIFTIFYRLSASSGSSIVCLSVAVNLLCFPLYQMADDRQRVERAKQKSMERWVRHIRDRFRGDERYLMLSALYRSQGYRPLNSAFGALPLLLQIPFFIAAYGFLSGLSILEGTSYLILSDLSKPDGLIAFDDTFINVLPILMTVFNCMSAALYTHGSPMRDRIQAYGLAIVFLVLLYNSPSGLVLYWTCNQILSLIKNAALFHAPNREMGRILFVQGYGGILVLAFAVSGVMSGPALVGEVVAIVVCVVALWSYYFLSQRDEAASQPSHHERDQSRCNPKNQGILGTSATDFLTNLTVSRRTATIQFFLAASLLALLMGLLIPSATISSSPQEFVNLRDLMSPNTYLVRTVTVWVGMLVFWTGIYYLLSPESGRKAFVLALWCLTGTALVCYFFGKDYGVLTGDLQFEDGLRVSWTESLASVASALGVTFVLAYIWKRWNAVLIPTLSILGVSVLVLCTQNLIAIDDGYREIVSQRAAATDSLYDVDGTLANRIELSQRDRNVVILFMDRAISGYVPYIFHECPELVQQFDGFTYYPNTISYGYSTVFGSPSIYGGYEYTPAAMNERDSVLCVDKHNESLRVLPELFSRGGRDSYVVNPAYPNYQWGMDASVLDDIEYCKALDLSGVYSEVVSLQRGITEEIDFDRRLFCYGLFKALPTVLQPTAYDEGRYLSPSATTAPASRFMDEYSVLEVLPEITGVDSPLGTLVEIHNQTTHEPHLLQLPDYVPADHVDNEKLDDPTRFTLDGKSMRMDNLEQNEHYHVNAATYLRLGTWFDWMRDQGVYDNTRIIIVSDHGKGLAQWPELVKDDDLDIEGVNAVLLVKDFDAHGFTSSDEFMTTADVPILALRGIVEDPVNPYTMVPITDDEKYAHDQLVTTSWHWHTENHPGTTFDTSDRPWYSVHDNIFDLNNWTRME